MRIEQIIENVANGMDVHEAVAALLEAKFKVPASDMSRDGMQKLASQFVQNRAKGSAARLLSMAGQAKTKEERDKILQGVKRAGDAAKSA